MQISLQWLNDYIDISQHSIESIAKTLTDIGLEVEAIQKSTQIPDTVVVGRILAAARHPNADSLQVCQVDVAGAAPLTIVCGAPNARKDLTVAVALVGSSLPNGIVIKEAKIRGEASFGMLCSYQELGLTSSETGIIELSHSLTLGSAVTAALGMNDVVMTLNVTPNRADCLGHVGVARDLSAKLGIPLKKPAASLPNGSAVSSKSIQVKLQSDHCARFCALRIDQVSVTQSPAWLKRRLEACGMRSINLIVDLTNYVMMELNHPIHAYDADKIEGPTFIIRNATSGETIVTLDGHPRSLQENDLLICDGKKPIGIAGVMGGQNSEVSTTTKSIILESAYFDPASVRQTSKRLGLISEASRRFERGIDPLDAEIVAKRFAILLGEIMKEPEYKHLPKPVIAKDVVDQSALTLQPKLIAMNVKQARDFLAIQSITADQIKKIFAGLELRFVDQNQDRMVFEIPTWRVDIERECDLIEEVGRMVGFDKIPLTLPKMSLEPTPESPQIAFIDDAKKSLAVLGFRETISFPFWSREEYQKLSIPENHPFLPKIKLKNPIADDASHMQTTLVVGLVKAVCTNRKQGIKGAKLFESGRGYFHADTRQAAIAKTSPFATLHRPSSHYSLTAKKDASRPIERQYFAAIMDQPLVDKSWDTAKQDVSFYVMKGKLESWLKSVGVVGASYIVNADIVGALPWLHPKCCAAVTYKGDTLGWIGELNPSVCEAYGLDPLEAPILFEMDLDKVYEGALKASRVSSQSWRFPPSARDLALLVDESVTHDEMRRVIANFSGKKNLQDFQLFDVYQGESIPLGKKSVAWSFNFQSPDHTLTDQEIDTEFKALSQHLLKEFAAEQR
jgi:phenylalanyl-tRNA synthetase beta chain